MEKLPVNVPNQTLVESPVTPLNFSLGSKAKDHPLRYNVLHSFQSTSSRVDNIRNVLALTGSLLLLILNS